MSLIVPWNEPNGTPCCCGVCEFFSDSVFLSNHQLFPLNNTQYATLIAGGYFDTQLTLSADYTINSEEFTVNDSYSLTHRLRYEKPINVCFVDGQYSLFTLTEASVSRSDDVAVNDSGSEDVITIVSQTTNDSTTPPQLPVNLFDVSLYLYNTNGPSEFPVGMLIQITGILGYAIQFTARYEEPGGIIRFQNFSTTHVISFRSTYPSGDTENATITFNMNGENIAIPANVSDSLASNLPVTSFTKNYSFPVFPRFSFIPYPP